MAKKDDPVFVEQRDQGDYAVRRAKSERASAVEPTQGKAIDRAHDLTEGPIHVERVRNTKNVNPDKWRKP